MFDLIADVEKVHGDSDGYVYSFALRNNTKVKPSPARKQSNASLKSQRPNSTTNNYTTPSAESQDISKRTSSRNKQYMSAVESGDKKTQERLIKEAADEAGYTEHLYHGTNLVLLNYNKRRG